MDPRFAQAAAALGLSDADPSMVEQASKFWEMMDDMATSNPEGYQRFIKKQMQEREKYMEANKPPTAKFLIKCKDAQSEKVIWINFSESDRVKPQPSPDAAVNVVVQEPTIEVSEGAKITLYEVVFHPDTFTKIETDSSFKDQAIQLGLDCVEERAKKLFDAKKKGIHNIKFVRSTMKFRERPFKKKDILDVLSEAKEKMDKGEEFDLKIPSVLDTGTEDGVHSGSGASQPPEVIIPGLNTSKEQNKSSNGDGLETLTPDAQSSRKPIIEVVAEQSGGVAMTSGAQQAAPPYTCTKNEDQNCYDVRVTLPGVCSVSEIVLDVAENKTAQMFKLDVDLSVKVNPDSVSVSEEAIYPRFAAS